MRERREKGERKGRERKKDPNTLRWGSKVEKFQKQGKGHTGTHAHTYTLADRQTDRQTDRHTHTKYKPARVKNLHADLGVVFVDGFGDNLVSVCLPFGGEFCSKGRHAASPVGSNATGDHDAHTTARAFLKEGCHLLQRGPGQDGA